ncbi:YhbY family RNA-binding protein [Candidatus Bathyarchaeota archaeon]|nr:YhbY family RNA-binding protein [Candidatus Bathyarchaeota archaeon]
MSKLTTGMKRRIKRKLSGENPTIWVGKNGISEQLLKEIEKQLEKNEMVKVKILKSALGKTEAKHVALSIAGQTTSSLVEVRGHTFMLYKRRKK